MADEQELTVLAQYRPYQHILETFNGENYRNKSNREVFENIRYAACVIALIVSTIAGIILGCWYCVDVDFEVDTLSISLPTILANFQMLVVYIALAMKNRSILSILDGLQKIINEREFPLLSFREKIPQFFFHIP